MYPPRGFALHAAWRTGLGVSPSLPTVERMLVRRWQVSDVQRLTAAARRACPDVLEFGGVWVDTPSVAYGLCQFVHNLVEYGHCSLPQALDWMERAAGAPGYPGTEPHVRDDLLSPMTVAEWQQALPGIEASVMALCWAAGLAPVEAEQRHAVGTLIEADLSVLAGLRGFRLY